MTGHDDDLFTGWRAPSAPSGLERRVLQAARDPEHPPTPRRLEDRIWYSRPLRLAWLAAACVLVALNLAIGGGGAVPAAPVTAGAEGPAIDEDVGIEIPPAPDEGMTLAEAYQLAAALLDDPCFDPFSGGDCS